MGSCPWRLCLRADLWCRRTCLWAGRAASSRARAPSSQRWQIVGQLLAALPQRQRLLERAAAGLQPLHHAGQFGRGPPRNSVRAARRSRPIGMRSTLAASSPPASRSRARRRRPPRPGRAAPAVVGALHDRVAALQGGRRRQPRSRASVWCSSARPGRADGAASGRPVDCSAVTCSDIVSSTVVGRASTGRLRRASRRCCSRSTRLPTARRSRVRAVPIRRTSSVRSGTTRLAASVGVEARTSATKSTSGVSVSWPIAEITGVRQANTARQSASSEKGSRSSTPPPPRAMMITSTAGSRSSTASASMICGTAEAPGPPR